MIDEHLRNAVAFSVFVVHVAYSSTISEIREISDNCRLGGDNAASGSSIRKMPVRVNV